MRHNIIGDIHGRKTWKEVFDPDAVNIFVGDYFDPYNTLGFFDGMPDDYDDSDYISSEDCIRNLSEIIELKRANPGSVVLLFGNHDLHYFSIGEIYSRYDRKYDAQIRKFLSDNVQHFHGIAYGIENKVLVSYAGVTLPWLERHAFPAGADLTPDNVARHCNSLFFDGYAKGSDHWQGLENYKFDTCCDADDRRGDSVGAPPVWVRPAALFDDNAFAETGYIQVVGHTKVPYIQCEENVYFVDCLGKLPADGDTSHMSLKYENGKFKTCI